ncbi:hypothetical protein [Dryocola sp. LX212]
MFRLTSWSICLALIFRSTVLFAAPDAGSVAARKAVIYSLSKALLCQRSDGISLAGNNKSDSTLKKAGASIVFGDDDIYNNFTYSFAEPLLIEENNIYNVQQNVGEGGAVLLAEAKGDMITLVKNLGAQPTNEDEWLGMENVLFVKPVKSSNSQVDDTESYDGEIVIGQSPEQKQSGRFIYGCIQKMEF